jgi:hypothetical protein
VLRTLALCSGGPGSILDPVSDEVFRGFPQYLQEDSTVVPLTCHCRFPSRNSQTSSIRTGVYEPNVAVEHLSLLLLLWEVPGSNLDPEIGYSE